MQMPMQIQIAATLQFQAISISTDLQRLLHPGAAWCMIVRLPNTNYA